MVVELPRKNYIARKMKNSRKNKFTTIYTLHDPTTSELRYVGKTVLRPALRLSGHISQARRSARWHVSRWIRTLPGKPVMRVVAAVENDLGAETERRLVALLRASGARLTNLTDGGDGALGYRHTLQHRARLKGNKFSLGVSPSAETREKQRIANTGRKHTAEELAKMSAALKGNKNGLGHTLTAEHRAAISASRKGNQATLGRKHTIESRLKMSASLKGKKFGAAHRLRISIAAKARTIHRDPVTGRLLPKEAW